jgi:prepilin-type N-terminal cleavage/methylation domain-containing protein
MRPPSCRTNRNRRGVTLIEMLVTVALLLIMMSILVSVFRSATGALQTQRVVAQLDQNLRRLDSVLRRDLEGVTANMDASQPVGPDQNQGYFEYIENELADLQGEDTDDILAFTAKAPDGQPFVGRLWIPSTNPQTTFVTPVPVTISSDYAEVIYFLRNGNLYRRVLLIAPHRVTSLTYSNIPNDKAPTLGSPKNPAFLTGLFGVPMPPNGTGTGVSWQGMNDISAHPAPFSPPSMGGVAPLPIPVPNDLGDLTDRDKRYSRPRFADDYNSPSNTGPDGVPDDFNGDGINDYYPTLYPGVFTAVDNFGQHLVNNNTGTPGGVPIPPAVVSYDSLPFPFIYPGAYSKGIDATGTVGSMAGGAIHFQGPGTYPNVNFAPLQAGESFVGPPFNQAMPVPQAAAQAQTFWGFPTWAETMSPNWTDPVWRLNFEGFAAAPQIQSPGLSIVSTSLLPSVSNQINADIPSQTFNDGAGGTAFLVTKNIWEDDLVMTGVRSFDVKAYDAFASAYSSPGVTLTPGYYDLGYAAAQPNPGGLGAGVTLTSTPLLFFNNGVAFAANLTPYPGSPIGFGHEGRIPPLLADNRVDPQWPFLIWPNSSGGGSLLPNEVGDNSTSVIRLRRTFDTWSTTYSMAPAVPTNPLIAPPFPNTNNNNKPFRPVYPSYPAPYPVQMRGIQVQIRVVDPKNQHIKVLTIRHDFSDKL